MNHKNVDLNFEIYFSSKIHINIVIFTSLIVKVSFILPNVKRLVSLLYLSQVKSIVSSVGNIQLTSNVGHSVFSYLFISTKTITFY